MAEAPILPIASPRRCCRSPLVRSCQGFAQCWQPALAATWRQRSAARLSAMWTGRPRNRPIRMPR
eukprot:11392588-Alexandrium_andersonii.AAC.1